jgi:hypothetical protein
MSARSRSSPVRTLIRLSQCSRLQAQCLSSAYELALPVVRRCLGERSSTTVPRPRASVAITAKCVGG